MRIVIIGCGAIGSNIATNLAYDLRAADHSMLLIDMDKVEYRNIIAGTQQYDSKAQGRPKAQALAARLSQIISTSKLGYLEKQIDQVNYSKVILKDDLVLDCTDNVIARDLFSGLPGNILHIGFSPLMTGMAIWNPLMPKLETEPELQNDICEAEGARSFVQLISSLATLTVINFLNTGIKTSWLYNRKSIIYI